MKWIQASEGLPETGIGFLKYVWVRNTDTKCGCMHALENLLKLDGLNNIEWLDESTPVPDKVEAKKFLTDFINEIEKEFAGDNLEYLHYAADRFLNNRDWQSTQSDAVEFGEWLKTFEPLTKEHGQWVLDCQISSEQLYQLFKQSK